MASSRDYLYYVLELLSNLNGITYKRMMGEYIIYYKSKIIGGIYDDRFLIKQTKSTLELIENPTFEIPYPNAKEMILIDTDDRDFIENLIDSMYLELPEKK